MKTKVDSNCTCDCGCPKSGKDGAGGRAMLAGAIGGIVGVLLLGFLAATLLRRVGPRLMPRMMERMVRNSDCSPEMRACMEKCGCGPRADESGRDESGSD